MRHLILALSLFAFSLPTMASTDWRLAAEKVARSAVFIESKEGSCTGFVIDNDRDYVLTAAHCDAKDLFVDQSPAKVISKDVKKDLMVVHIDDLDRPALKLAKDNPKTGDEVASFGYGYGLERPMFRVTHISDDKIYIPYEGIGGPLVAVDATFVPGQSGGPVVNVEGDVVMVVQLGTPIVGFGVGAETIKDKVGKYFQRPAKP
jgi:S1-C subfamily serine protease